MGKASGGESEGRERERGANGYNKCRRSKRARPPCLLPPPSPPSSELLTWSLGRALLTAPTLRPIVPLMAEAEPVQALAMAATLLHSLGGGKNISHPLVVILMSSQAVHTGWPLQCHTLS